MSWFRSLHGNRHGNRVREPDASLSRSVCFRTHPRLEQTREVCYRMTPEVASEVEKRLREPLAVLSRAVEAHHARVCERAYGKDLPSCCSGNGCLRGRLF